MLKHAALLFALLQPAAFAALPYETGAEYSLYSESLVINAEWPADPASPTTAMQLNYSRDQREILSFIVDTSDEESSTEGMARLMQEASPEFLTYVAEEALSRYYTTEGLEQAWYSTQAALFGEETDDAEAGSSGRPRCIGPRTCTRCFGSYKVCNCNIGCWTICLWPYPHACQSYCFVYFYEAC
jgi:hypothetical protein